MACTTILVGKKASYDGSTMIARNDDSPAGQFTAKKFVVILPKDQPKIYKSVLSHVQFELPDDPQRYTAVPNALKGEGIWAASGVNASNVAMTATETITTNVRVLGADPLVEYIPAEDGKEEVPGGLGEEDLVVVTLPYIKTAREGVLRLGSLLEQYGTYESNGIAFSDVNEIWWLETIGGHHWIAKRVPDEEYVVMPNQLGIDEFDFDDAYGKQENYLCSADLKDFVKKNHLNLDVKPLKNVINPRTAFGSHSDADHVYNTPRAWYMLRTLNPTEVEWDGPDADLRPEDDFLPWSMVPENKITVEDVKYVLSSHFQGTPYDPYARFGDPSRRGAYRSIGINRNDFLAILQIRPYATKGHKVVEWLSFASNAFNASVPFYTNVSKTPEYLCNTGSEVSTENFYWSNRLIAALADASYGKCIAHIERYQEAVAAQGHAIINEYDEKMENVTGKKAEALCEEANEKIAQMLKKETASCLNHVLYERSNEMKNSYARSDN